MSTVWNVLWVACGGALGAVARYSTTLLAARWFGPKYPWGTVAVNLIGCFVMGVLFALSRDQIALHHPHSRLFLMVGFLGAFTTFSSFALDSVQLMRQQSLPHLLFNMGLQNLAGLLLVVFGIWLAENLT